MSTLRRKKENHNTDKTMREKETKKGRNGGKSLRSRDVREGKHTAPGWIGRQKLLLINNSQTVFHTLVLLFTNPV